MSFEQSIDFFIKNALQEDIGNGDITTDSIIKAGQVSSGRIIARETMVVAGLPIAKKVFQILDKKVIFRSLVKDGTTVKQGEVLAVVKGNTASLLKAERVMLNILQRLSGIASLTRKFIERIKGVRCTILDTRKTTPGLRALEKYAVRAGGGKNHRFGLYDAILIKNNHIDAAGGVKKAFRLCRDAGYASDEIEIEVRTMQELSDALDSGAQKILLDNMTEKELKKAVKLTYMRATLEASGNITLNNVSKIAKMGIDCISIGALTHSAKSMDISFVIEPIPCMQK